MILTDWVRERRIKEKRKRKKERKKESVETFRKKIIDKGRNRME